MFASFSHRLKTSKGWFRRAHSGAGRSRILDIRGSAVARRRTTVHGADKVLQPTDLENRKMGVFNAVVKPICLGENIPKLNLVCH